MEKFYELLASKQISQKKKKDSNKFPEILI